MNRTFIYPTMALFAMALFFTSCQSSRVWATKDKEPKHKREAETYRRPEPPPPPRYTNYVALIITPSPGFVMKQNPNGRYYHRSRQGYMYWKGNDNRFYIDRTHLRNVSYSKGEYNEWKRNNRR